MIPTKPYRLPNVDEVLPLISAGNLSYAAGGRELIPLLRSVHLLTGLSDDELTIVGEHVKHKLYKPDVVLFSTGDLADRMYMIVLGSVKIQRNTQSGRTLHLATREKGDSFGEIALLDGGVRMAGAVTISPCELLTLDRESLTSLIAALPHIAPPILACLAQRLRQFADSMELHFELDTTGRFADCLLHLAHSEGCPQSDGAVELARRRTHEEFADMIGSVRESVTRAIRDLESADIIRAGGRPTAITILDMAALRKRCARW